MSKRKASRPRQIERRASRVPRRGAAPGAGVCLLLMTVALLAQQGRLPGGLLPRPTPSPVGQVVNSATALTPANPSKEYVYAGSRLVAIEEPGSVPSPSPTPMPTPCTPPTSLIIGEFRMRGSAGPADEFVELYNNSDSAISVCTADQSLGWTVAARSADGTTAAPVFTVPHGTVIPARGHYLGAHGGAAGGYSLSSHPAGAGTTATGDVNFMADLADDSGLALFKTANPANFNAANRLDAVGFSGPNGAIPDLYREGAGLAPVGSGSGEYTFVRRVGGNLLPQDTNDNASDWLFLSTDGGVYGGVQSSLGAPGPENLSSPVLRLGVHVNRLDPNVAVSAPPNRVRRLCSDPAVEECDPARSALGTLAMRRKVVNNTGAAVTRLRFRIYDLTTYPSPTGTADLRALTSGDITVQLSDGTSVPVRGTTLETPPAQAMGGGLHSAWTLTLGQPLQAGDSVNVQFLTGVQQGGGFRIFILPEALP